MNVVPKCASGSELRTSALPELALVEKELELLLDEARGVIGEMCRYLFSAGGKRIRPLLVITSGCAAGEFCPSLIQAAVAAELIHMASLVHDDIIDKSDKRRNRPSLNSLWGNHYAVLCGDYLFARAFEIMAKNRLIESMDQMVAAIKSMCTAEVDQAETCFKSDTSIDEYYARIAGKTAVFLECCCKSGAYAAGASGEKVNGLGEYGLNLGFAFQIIDDILDFSGRAGIMGKPVYEDIRRGIVTLPVIYLQQDQTYGIWVRKLLSERKITRETASKIASTLKREGFISMAHETAVLHTRKALTCLMDLSETPYTAILSELADMVVSRNN